MTQPLASILIGNFNYGRFLREAIDSALAQTYPHVEVVVVDDGSTDDSREIMAEYGERILALHKTNGGQGSAFNAGFVACRGDVVFFLDADDLFHPRKVELVVAAKGRHQHAGWAIHNFARFSPGGSEETVSPYPEEAVLDETRRTRRGRQGVYCPPTSGLAFRRSLLASFFPVPEFLRITTDNYLKFKSSTISPVLTLPQTLMRQRVHGANLYTNLPARELERKRYEVNMGIGLTLMEQATSYRLGVATLASGLISGRTSGVLSLAGLLKRIIGLPHVSAARRFEVALMVVRMSLKLKDRLLGLRGRLAPARSSPRARQAASPSPEADR